MNNNKKIKDIISIIIIFLLIVLPLYRSYQTNRHNERVVEHLKTQLTSSIKETKYQLETLIRVKELSEADAYAETRTWADLFKTIEKSKTSAEGLGWTYKKPSDESVKVRSIYMTLETLEGFLYQALALSNSGKESFTLVNNQNMVFKSKEEVIREIEVYIDLLEVYSREDFSNLWQQLMKNWDIEGAKEIRSPHRRRN